MPRPISFRVVLFVGLLVCPAPEVFAQHCQPYWTAAYKCAMGCGPCGNGPRTNNAPAPEPGEAEGLVLNQKGIDAYNSGQYETAKNLFQEALLKVPNNVTVQANLRRATDQIAIEKRQSDEAFNQGKQQALSQLLGVSNSGVFDSATGLKGVVSTDSGLKDAPNSGNANGLKNLNTDPMIVDARNVPTGLPTSVEDAIPRTPAGDRVRKGFQAIQSQDWKVALAWFQDARNHEPADPSLQRLVDLAQYTLDYRARTDTAVQTESKPDQPLPNRSTTIKRTEGAVVTAAIDGANVDWLGYSAAVLIASRARADKVYREFVAKYGDRDPQARMIAVGKAASGEGLSGEELAADLQRARAAYEKLLQDRRADKKPADNRPITPADNRIPTAPTKSYPDSLWGNFLRFYEDIVNPPGAYLGPVADEMILGRKG